MYPDSKLTLNYESEKEINFFTVRYEPLNSWSPHQVELWGERFATVEHGYHFRKFRETDPDVAERILKAPSPWAAMKLDRENSTKRREDWHSVKVGIMKELMRAKLDQNQDVRDCLLATGDKKIVERSPWDLFWGSGLDGTGENTLGRLWVELRAKL